MVKLRKGLRNQLGLERIVEEIARTMNGLDKYRIETIRGRSGSEWELRIDTGQEISPDVVVRVLNVSESETIGMLLLPGPRIQKDLPGSA